MKPPVMTSVDLFAGAGGLALGVSQAGFRHRAIVEWDNAACETIRVNRSNGVEYVRDWNLIQGDVRHVNFEEIGHVDLIAAGVPCQPWSIGGKHRGFDDERNLFPEALRAVVSMRPKAVLIENVKGLTRQAFADYFTYIQWMLRFPEVARRESDTWMAHRARLEKFVTSDGKGYDGLRYNVVARLVNAASFGVPQKRERVFVVAFRDDLGVRWSFPTETHSPEALLVDQWLTGEYWDRHKVSVTERPPKPKDLERRMADLPLFGSLPWRTVRDALSGLPDPVSGRANTVPNHRFQPGARSYEGHTGSAIDEPAKTLKAGDHGVPGGENMIAFPDGSFRYFTVREAARIQTFPESFVFGSSWSENMRQLGNAVPVTLGEIMAKEIRACLSKAILR